jgi:lysozyme
MGKAAKMSINKEALDLIKEFEGFRAKAYVDPVGIWTIGYGTTAEAGVGISPKKGDTMTRDEAEWYLQKAVDKFAAQIAPKIIRPINANEFGAFVSLAYNIGPGAFGGSTALRKFNAGDKRGAADAILLWNKGTVKGKKVVLKGLVRRREAERALFLTPAHLPPISVDHDPVPTPRPSSFWADLFAAIAAIFKGAKK